MSSTEMPYSCTRVVVLDNLGEGVLKPDIYDPTLNPVYADMLRHYGVVAMPCRVADPDRKGKVESGVGHAQKTPLKGMRFESPQAYLDHWEARWADTRIHGTTKRQVEAMFAEGIRPANPCSGFSGGLAEGNAGVRKPPRSGPPATCPAAGRRATSSDVPRSSGTHLASRRTDRSCAACTWQ